MKNKFLFVFIVFVSLIIVVAACTKKSEAPASPTAVPTVIPIATATPLTAVYYSVAEQDGVVYSGGTVNTAGTAASAGDSNTEEVLQGFVSFSMPVLTQPIASAQLRLYFITYTGDPLTTIGPVRVAHITPNYTSLSVAEFLAYDSNVSIGTMVNTYMEGTFVLDVTAQVESDRLAGRTYSQFRIYLNGPADGNATYDYMQFFTSDNSTNKPELMIRHYL